jgi:thioredoxin 1
MPVYELATLDSFTKAISLDKVIIDFYAHWCGPCKNISPYLEKLSEENKDIRFFKVNVGDLEEVAEKCNIQAMPTFMAFSKGKAISRMTGANIDNLTKFIQSLKDYSISK